MRFRHLVAVARSFCSRSFIISRRIYDLRTNLHFTLKENPLKRGDLDDFVRCYNPRNRHDPVSDFWTSTEPQWR